MRNNAPFSHALPVPRKSFHAPLYMTHAGWERILPGQDYPVLKPAVYFFSWEEGRILPEFCLALCLEGGGIFETQAGRQNIRAGDAFLARPGEWHRHRPTKTAGWTLLWIHFNGDLPHRWMAEAAFNLAGNKPVIEFHDLFVAQFDRLLTTVHRASTRNPEELSWQAIGLLSHFVSSHVPVSDAGSTGDLVSQAIECIWNHTHSHLEVGDVARHVGCSRRTLETRLKQATGKTVLEEIQSCRMERALHLLQSTDLPIKQVVFRSGFQSAEQMRLVFQKTLGKAPNDCRLREETT